MLFLSGLVLWWWFIHKSTVDNSSIKMEVHIMWVVALFEEAKQGKNDGIFKNMMGIRMGFPIIKPAKQMVAA